MEEKDLVNTEVQEQEIVQPDENLDQSYQQPEETIQSAPRSNKEENFAALREKVERERRERERIERERDEAYNILRQLEQRAQEYQRQQQEPEPQFDNFDDDDIVDGKALKMIQKKHQSELERIRSEMQMTAQKQAAMLVENQIKSKYPDYYDVVNEATIMQFREAEPEIAQTIANMNDLYTQANLTYKWIERLGLKSGSNRSSNDQQRASINASKPKVASAVSPTKGASGLENASSFSAELTEQRKRELFAEMQRLANSR